jgi:energy-coupling factor transporter ATP-binding protein EcfA2
MSLVRAKSETSMSSPEPGEQKMRIESVLLNNFGPFRSYHLTFDQKEPACVLLTGKNNEGKSNILLALKLVNSALRSIGRGRQRVAIDGVEFYRLSQRDTRELNIGRMLHNYQGTQARIEVTLDDGFEITVILDADMDMVYTDYDGKVIPDDSQNILGFIPPLGPLSENEELLTEKHVRTSLETSLAPRHLRNHFRQLLSREEYRMVQTIIRESWPSLELLDYEYHYEDNLLKCFYKEGRFTREIAWAGQGLQVWFQIVTHLVRLRSSTILVLDEPEINLHPEKQNDLIRILTEYHGRSSIIATHSVELMNNVNVSHIIHVQKQERKPLVKTTDDRTALDLIRSRIGSNFNLIASQFETYELILYTEDTFDFSIVVDLARALGIKRRVFNIPLHGLSEYHKAIAYKEAYELLIGHPTLHTALLDRDYYPEAYLCSIRDKLKKKGIRTMFTMGKEVENVFLQPSVLDALIPQDLKEQFSLYWDRVFEEAEIDCFGSYQSLHEHFLEPKIDAKSVIKQFKPRFDKCWKDKTRRHLIIAGKPALGRLRKFHKLKMGNNLTQKSLIDALVGTEEKETRSFLEQLFHLKPVKKQCLHY